MTLNGQLRTLLQKRFVFRSPPQKFEWRQTHTYQQQKCRPMTLVSGNIRRVWIFARVPLGGGIKWEWDCRRPMFSAIWVATSSETLEVGQHYYMAISNPLPRPVIDCKMNDLEWPWVATSCQNSLFMPALLECSTSRNCLLILLHLLLTSGVWRRAVTRGHSR